ncbi:MAG: AAA family ATPase [Pyrinomonadaceae bacterium]
MRRFARDCRTPDDYLSHSQLHRLINQQLSSESLAHLKPAITASAEHFLVEKHGFEREAAQAIVAEFTNAPEEELMLTNRCMLSPAASRFFGLKFDPFDVDRLPESDGLFRNEDLDTLAEQMKDAVRFHRFVAVIGDVGTGKTLLKLRMATELEEEGAQVRLLYPEFFDMGDLSVSNIASAILAELGQAAPRDKPKRVRVLRETLTQLQQEGVEVAIVIDEAHRLADKVISSLKNFWELTNGRHSRLLGVILFGQPSFVETRLRDVKFKEIRQRVQIYSMPVLNGSTFDYVKHRIALAGGDIDKLFDRDCLDRIAANARTPLAVGNLVNESLMAAFDVEEKRVTLDLEFFRKLPTHQHGVLARRRAA